MKQYYIRFGNIPWDEKSYIYNEQGIIIGKQKGVSVFKAVKAGDYYTPEVPTPHTEGGLAQYNKYTRDNNEPHLWRNMLLCTGDLVGYDDDNLPLIVHVKVVDVLPFDTIFPGRRNHSEL